jgi:hypothetical protein
MLLKSRVARERRVRACNRFPMHFLPVTPSAERAERNNLLRFSPFRFAKIYSARPLYPQKRTFLAAVGTSALCRLCCKTIFAIKTSNIDSKQAQARNIDLKYTSVGFHYCSFAVQQRVLQHNLPKAVISQIFLLDL